MSTEKSKVWVDGTVHISGWIWDGFSASLFNISYHCFGFYTWNAFAIVSTSTCFGSKILK